MVTHPQLLRHPGRVSFVRTDSCDHRIEPGQAGGLAGRPRSIVKLQGKLHQARSARLADLPECSTESLVVGIQELCMVEGVKHLCAELKRFEFSELGPFEERDVPIVDAWAAKRVPPQVSKRS